MGSIKMTVMATVESSRTSSATKPWWNLRYAWDHCPVAWMVAWMLTDGMTFSSRIS